MIFIGINLALSFKAILTPSTPELFKVSDDCGSKCPFAPESDIYISAVEPSRIS